MPDAFETWPATIHQVRCAPTDEDDASPPQTAHALDQMHAALMWLRWLDADLQRIAWDRANSRPWKAIAHEHGIDRTTAWRRWTCAMITIAARLNAVNDATTLQHQDTPRPASNRVA